MLDAIRELVVAVCFGGVGSLVLLAGADELWKAVSVYRGGPVSVRDLPDCSGAVEIEGTATLPDGQRPVESPFTGSDSLVYEYEVRELDYDEGLRATSGWNTVDEGGERRAFLVGDDTGTVRVSPEGADLRLRERTTAVDRGEEPPERIARFIDETAGVQTPDRSVDLGFELHYGKHQKFVERRLDPGEEVYVLGTVSGDDAGGGGRRLDGPTVEDGDAARFVVSDTDQHRTAREALRRGVAYTAAGLCFAGGGVALFAQWLGSVL